MDKYAGFWKRFLAVIIDGIVIWVLQAFVIVPILGLVGFSIATAPPDMSDPDAAMGMVASIIAAAGAIWLVVVTIQILYGSFMESSKYQGTLGKMALGIIVTDMNGGKLDFTKALVRNLCKLISNFTMLIGYIIAGFTAKKQALHDLIASTLVVNK
jgi:uncharacterized RDD family membrane protein YckC